MFASSPQSRCASKDGNYISESPSSRPSGLPIKRTSIIQDLERAVTSDNVEFNSNKWFPICNLVLCPCMRSFGSTWPDPIGRGERPGGQSWSSEGTPLDPKFGSEQEKPELCAPETVSLSCIRAQTRSWFSVLLCAILVVLVLCFSKTAFPSLSAGEMLSTGSFQRR